MEYFFELLQVALGNRSGLSGIPTAEEWESLLETATKQSLPGIAFAGVEKLPREQWPSKQLLREWLGRSHLVEQRNVLATEVCFELCRQFEDAGFDVCVLKGQANHAYYPEELTERRSCGDIDLWVRTKKDEKADGKRIINFVRQNYGMTGLCHLHVNMAKYRGVPVEVHFRPSFMSDPFRNRRFQRLFAEIDRCVCTKEIDGVTLPAMRIEYDIIYQMNHIYRHLMDEGVGLRQILDYYFACDSFHDSVSLDGGKAVDKVMKEVERLGMKRFAGALMYVLIEVFGISKDKLLCPAVEKDGRFLLDEIMIAGNFGRNDPRMKFKRSSSHLFNQIQRAFHRFKRNLQFLTTYPGEVVWEPFARMWHYVLKRITLWTI